MTPDTWIQGALALVGTVGGVVAARSARRTKRQESRDDFIAITDQQGRTIQRLEKRLDGMEAETERQRKRIGEQDAAVGWLIGRVRDLTGYIRVRGLEPPTARPIPVEAREYLQNIET